MQHGAVAVAHVEVDEVAFAQERDGKPDISWLGLRIVCVGNPAQPFGVVAGEHAVEGDAPARVPTVEEGDCFRAAQNPFRLAEQHV